MRANITLELTRYDEEEEKLEAEEQFEKHSSPRIIKLYGCVVL